MKAHARYNGEELEALLSADVVQTLGDATYGGPRIETTFENVDIEAVTILGVDVDPKSLRIDLQSAICALWDELEPDMEE